MQETVNSAYNENVLLLPPELIKEFNLDYNRTIILKFGSAQTEVNIREHDHSLEEKAVARLCSDAAAHLKIPGKTSLRIKREGQVLRMGPAIGILTYHSIIRNKKFDYYLPFVLLNKGNGFFYIFSGRLVNPETKTIRGFYYDYSDRKWKMGEFPYPDVVIDRCYPNNYRCHSILEKEIGPSIFNKKTCIDKLEFAETIAKDSYLGSYIPETKLFQQTSDLNYFLQKYQGAFLKPVNAMMGKGIVEITPDNGGLRCRYVKKEKKTAKTVTETITSTEEVTDILKQASGSTRDYVIQQLIPRMEYKGGPFSFRVWAMKNGEGTWVVPGMFAKYSINKGFLTNFTAGAKLVSLNTLLNSILPGLSCSMEQLLTQLELLTLKTAEILDGTFGPLGELGMDIVLDIKGRPWLIEANGNPGKNPVYIQKEYPEWPSLVFKYPLDYAGYLAGFSKEQELVKIE